MGVPVSQMWTVATYVLKQKLARRKRYPLVLMLEPLFRCNLACAGCGKVQYPAHILKKHLSPQQCFDAVEECGTPMVSIPGGEPLLHPDIHEIVDGLVARKKYVYLCTNAILLKQHLDRFKPSKYLTFSIHMDGEPVEMVDATGFIATKAKFHGAQMASWYVQGASFNEANFSSAMLMAWTTDGMSYEGLYELAPEDMAVLNTIGVNKRYCDPTQGWFYRPFPDSPALPEE